MRVLSELTSSRFLGALVDYYFLAGLLLAVAWLVQIWIRQPARRVAIDWIVAAELVVLAAVCALPNWPRLAVFRAVVPRTVADEAKSEEHAQNVSGGSVVGSPAVGGNRGMPRLPSRFPPDRPINLNKAAASEPAPWPHAQSASEPREAALMPATEETGGAWVERIAATYLSCMAIVLCWLIWGAIAAWRSCRRAVPAPQRLQDELARIVQGPQVPRLLVSPRVKSAAALGLFRPTILLPTALAEDRQAPTLRAVLRHEWAHIRNGDLWLLALCRLLLVPLFAHPLFWWLRSAVRRDQELLADAAAAGEERHAYAEELLQLARRTSGLAALSGSVGIWENSSQLSRRIAMLLQNSFRVQPRTTRRWRVLAVCLFTLVAIGMSLLTLRPHPALAQEARSAIKAGDATRPNSQPPHEPKAAEIAPATKDTITAGETYNFDGPIAGNVQNYFFVVDDADKDRMRLPGCFPLENPEFRRRIHISPKQEKKLREISGESRRQEEKFDHDLSGQISKLPSVRKQVDQILTAAQRVALKREMALPAAYELNFHPHVSLGLTQPQRRQIERIRAEEMKEYRDLDALRQERSEAFLRGLKGDRREKALALVEAKYRREASHDAVEMALGNSRDGSVLLPSNATFAPAIPATTTETAAGGLTLTVDDRRAAAIPNISFGTAVASGAPSYPVVTDVPGTELVVRDFIIAPAFPVPFAGTAGSTLNPVSGSTLVLGASTSDPAVAALAPLPYFGGFLSQSKDLDKDWGIDSAQAKQLAEIAKNFQTGQDRILQSIMRLSADERDKQRLEFLADNDKLKTEAERRAEKALTPQQVAAIKDRLLRLYAVQCFLQDPAPWRSIGIDEKEIAATGKEGDSYKKVYIEASGKIFDVLTPQQQEILFDEVEKQIEAASASGETKAGEAHVEIKGETAPTTAAGESNVSSDNKSAAQFSGQFSGTGSVQVSGMVTSTLATPPNDVDTKIDAANKSIARNPRDVRAYLQRGAAYAAIGKNAKALEDYNLAIRLAPNSAEAYRDRGSVLSSEGNNPKAIDDYSMVIRLDPKDHRAYYGRASVCQALGDPAKAQADYAESERLQRAEGFSGWLESYELIGHDAQMQKDLGLSADQVKRLWDIVDKNQSSDAAQKLFAQSASLPIGQRMLWLQQKLLENEKVLRENAAKRVEVILRPKQLEAYRNRALPNIAYFMLRRPDVLGIVAATEEQKTRLRDIVAQAGHETRLANERFLADSLVVLTPQQQARLRAAVQHPATYAGAAIVAYSRTQSYLEKDLTLPTDTQPSVHDLCSGSVRKELDFTATQEAQWQKISARFAQELAQQKLMADFPQKAESLLTAKQLTGLVAIRLRYELQALQVPSDFAKSLGVTEEQNSRLRRIWSQYDTQTDIIDAAGKQKSLAVLTAEQRKKLCDEITRLAGW